ncbi:helix-turn-helix domain-containing protein [Xiamenia xianingshaonis]|uniref:helix-turn-helix domain-containing protein n=1 Tax=Xiamenia xianingshaonis TaxID=2682776 RepID=UPI0013EB7B49|nr:helix-turn-helix transcriptional regulator [Xiamenia xianingshaonis]
MIRLRIEREKLKLSQSRLAALTGTMHPSSISQIEAGKRKPGYKQRDLIEKAMAVAGWPGKGDLFEEVN